MKKLIFYLLLITLTLSPVNAQKVGFLGNANSINELKDLDEWKAARWLVTEYGGEYIPLSDIESIDLFQYSVIWIHIDRWDGIPDVYEGFKNKKHILQDYYKKGGNLFLSVHAVNLLDDLGRIDYAPDICDAEKGGYNPDIWSINPVYGINCSGNNPILDRSGDNVFKGMKSTTLKELNKIEFKIYPLLGSGYKENHNCFWSMTVSDHPIMNEVKQKVIYWEDRYDATVLGTWGQVRDYFGATIVRFKPNKTFKGKCITVSLGAYEWNTNAKTKNPFHSNIIQLTRNVLDELKSQN